MKQIDLKGEINNLEIIVGDFKTPVSITEKTSRQKICEDIKDLKNTINKWS